MRLLILLALCFWLAPSAAGAQVADPVPYDPAAPVPSYEVPEVEAEELAIFPPVVWKESRAVGLPFADGRLVDGVRLPAEGEDFFTWDPIKKRAPNRSWRRYGTDTLVRTVLDVLAGFRAADPSAPRIGVGDLSRTRGGIFDQRFGGLGHLSHQNGLDVDVYYPRRDRRERAPRRVSQVDRRLSQDLVTRFSRVRHVDKVFVGWNVGLRGRRGVVSRLAHHDDHLHLRLRNPGR